MTRDAYKALMRESYQLISEVIRANAVLEHSLRLKQALTPFTDLSTLEAPQIQAFKDLLEPVNDAANIFEKERKSAMKKPVDGKFKEMGLRMDKAGTEIYNMIEELSAGRGRVDNPGEIDILLAQSRADFRYNTDNSSTSCSSHHTVC